MRTAADLERIAAATGCTLVGTYVQAGELVGEWQCPDIEDGQPMATAKLLEQLAATDESVDPFDSALVAALRGAAPNTARAAHAFVQSRVRFVDEDVETFQTPSVSLAKGEGDCDDSERVLHSLARAAGVPARFVYFLQDGQPAHVTVQLRDGGRWRWAETTIPARYGEHPFAAMRRLGIARADLDGQPWIFVNGEPRPLKEATLKGMGSMRAMGDASALPSYLGATFPATLAAWSKSIGADPLDVAKLLLSESGLQPGATNSSGFPSGQYAVGINQLAPVNWGYFAPLTASQYAALTAEEQIPYAMAYWKHAMAQHNLTEISARDLYWLNFLPATFVPYSTDEHVIVSSSSGYYTNNAGLDHGGKGYITAGDLQKSLDAQPAAHPTLWPLLSAALLQQTGGVTLAQAGAVIVGAGLVGALLVRPDLLFDAIDAVFG